MHDSDLPPPTVAFFARVVGVFLAIFLAALFVLHLTGCSATPAPLTVADVASNSMADEINVHVAAWKRRVKADAVKGELACKVSDLACRKKAVDDAIAGHLAEQHLLDQLATTQDLLQDALSTARLCRKAADVACAASSLDSALTLSSELRGLLANYYRENPQ